MASLNNVVLIGNISNEPELQYTDNGTALCTFSLAVNRQEDEVDFVPIKTWSGTAEAVNEYMSKGSPIAVAGAIRVDNYEDSEGNQRTYTYVNARTVQFISGGDEQQSKQKSSEPAPEPNTGNWYEQPRFR